MKWFDIPDELLPPVYRAIKDMYSYARTLDTELREFLVYMKAILDNFFIQTCDLKTIEYWERLLDIVLFGDETIEERRQNILLYLNNQNPTTEPFVRQKLTEIFGEDNYRLWLDVENGHPYDLHIEFYDTPLDNIKRFMLWFNKMCPAHLVLNSEHIEKAESEFEIYLHAESDHWGTATSTFSTGTETLYFGSSATTFDTIEI